MTGRRVRAVVVFAAALLLAVVSALGTGRSAAGRLEPTRPTLSVARGDPARVGGVTFRLVRFDVAPSFPAEDAGEPAVHGPAGSLIVLAVVEQTVTDRSIDLREYFCDFSLHAPGDVWLTDGDFTSLMRRPAALTCAGTDDAPARYDRPRSIGVTFVVPAAALTGQLSVWVAVNEGRDVVALAR